MVTESTFFYKEEPGLKNVSTREKYTVLKDITSVSGVTYEGRCRFPLEIALTKLDEPVWQLWRSGVRSESGVHIAEGIKSRPFDQIWDDRVTEFGDVPDVETNIKSILFDGVDEYVNFGNNFNFDISTAFTISMWVKPQNIAATRILFSKAGPGPAVDGWMIRHNATTGAIYYQMRGSSNRSFTSNVTLTASVWQLLTFTYAGGNNINGAHAYVNVTKGNTPASGTINGTMLVGQDFLIAQRSGTFFYSGHVDEVTIWNKELSQAEVTELYNGGVPLTPPTSHSANANLISYYKCGDGDTYPTLTDSVGSVNGTMTNMEAEDIVEDTP